MNIAIVASEETLIKDLVAQITRKTKNIEIETFINPLLALKYLSSHNCEILFVYSRIRLMAITQFINSVRKSNQEMEIYVIAETDAFNLDLKLAGADDIIIKSSSNEHFYINIKEIFDG